MWMVLSLVAIAALLDHAYWISGLLALIALFYALTAK
jgi:hypothetical protein